MTKAARLTVFVSVLAAGCWDGIPTSLLKGSWCLPLKTSFPWTRGWQLPRRAVNWASSTVEIKTILK